MKLSATRRTLILANIFNSLVAIYFVIIAIVGLVQLRWYHQLTITVKARHIITLSTSYFAFVSLIVVGVLLIGLFISSALRLASSTSGQNGTTILATGPPSSGGHLEPQGDVPLHSGNNFQTINPKDEVAVDVSFEAHHARPRPVGNLANARRSANGRGIVLRNASLSEESDVSICCSILMHLLAAIGLILILLIWLFNTGELVRDSISTQLDYAFARYQFTNRSNHYSIAIDGMQDANNCCGSLDFTDFPHQRVSGLSSGHYPGSCCGKNVFGVNARVLCTADEIYRAKQTSGCTNILANYYDLISLLLVPVALVCLFVNITIIALITISKRGNIGLGHHHLNQHQHHHHHHAFTHLGGGGGGGAVGDDGASANSNYQNRANLRQAQRRLQLHQGQQPSGGGGGGGGAPAATSIAAELSNSGNRHQEESI